MKKKLFLATILLLLCITTGDVKADYNGGNGGSGVPSSGDCSGLAAPCTWMNKSFTLVQITLIYYDGSSWIQQGNPYFITNSQYSLGKLIGDGISHERIAVNGSINTCGDANNPPYNNGIKGGCSYNIDWLKRMYSAVEGGAFAEINALDLINKMGINLNSLRNHNEKIDYNSIGYRFLIEPVYNWVLPNSTTEKYMTVKEMFRQYGQSSNSTQDAEWSWLLHTEIDDIGIRAPGGPTTNGDDIANKRLGYGYNIINPPNIFKSCYKVSAQGTPAVCEKTNEPNIGTYSEGYTKISCDGATQEEQDATENGRLVKTVNSNCKIYCKESVITKFPGNIMPAVTQGSYFVWPSFGKTKNELHQLDIEGTRNCVMKGNSCGNYTATVNDLYRNFETDAKIKYNDPDYKRDIKLEVDTTRNTSSISQSGGNITVKRNVSLKIPNNIYRYVDKQTGKSVDTKGGSNDRYTDIGFGNLPVSFKVPTGSKQNIQLFDIKLGVGNVFGNLANKTPYSCTYEATNISTKCVCPPGSKNPGKDLWCKIAGSGEENLSCATAQSKYCDVPNGTETPGGDESCPSRYCPPPNQAISLDACLFAGNTYNQCFSKLCTGGSPNIEYRCPDDTPNKGMLLTGCVEELEKKGYSTPAAFEACKTINCPIKGINIIYRTINLNNPFPSKNPNQGGAIAGFNLSVNGRYPGTNWNSRELVKTKILNNRSTTGNAVYEKQPMYSITLNANNMRAVRAYNRKKLNPAGYSDFTLDCLGTDGSRCRSNAFLRGNIKLLTGKGTCDRATGASQFDVCAR